jgi:hypothetical protein
MQSLVVKQFWRGGKPAPDLPEERLPFLAADRSQPSVYGEIEVAGGAPVGVQAELLESGEVLHVAFIRNGAVVADFAGGVRGYHHAAVAIPAGPYLVVWVERTPD